MLDCRAARLLLDQGVTPGPRPPTRATLGFHLAQCADCRNYRDALAARLLADLLGQSLTPAPPVVPALTPPEVLTPPPLSRSSRRWLWIASLLLLGAVGLVVLVSIGSYARTLFNIHRNVQAMIVTPAPPQPASGSMVGRLGSAPPPAASQASATPSIAPSDTPVPATPTRLPTPQPSATPLPSATPTALPPTAVPSATPIPLAPVQLPPDSDAGTVQRLSPAPPAGDAVTVLLLGSDRRPDEGEAARTDAIMIARIEPARQRAALLSLPRDLVVEIPGYGYDRINAAYAWGVQYGAPGGGPELARQTVSSLLGVPIDYYVVIDFGGFINAVDALGGVPVEVEKELYDPQFPTMDYGYTVAHFLPGTQQMNGMTALMYSRIRHPDSDFMRMRRQQAVVAGMLAQVRAGGTFAQLEKLEAMTATLRDYVRTDMSEARIVGLAWALRDLAPEQIERLTLTPDMVTFGIGSDQWAEQALPGAIEQLVAQLLDE